MELIIVAHKREGQSFINNLKLEKEEQFPSFTYSNKETVLLICGQGIQNAQNRLSLFLKLNERNICRVVNFGIAGRLDDSLKLNKVYPITITTLPDEDLIFSLIIILPLTSSFSVGEFVPIPMLLTLIIL